MNDKENKLLCEIYFTLAMNTNMEILVRIHMIYI